MNETHNDGWVMVDRETGFILYWTWHRLRRAAIQEMIDLMPSLNVRKVRKQWKAVKATRTITLLSD